MAKITPQSIANLKALFQDNEKALGANFSQLIDFFNNNKVTDNGDGTFTVGAITVDASKLYNLINNSSPNILPLDNEFTGKNTFDIAPINKANGKPYITEDSVPQVDLSNYPTKDQLATKADTSAIDPSVMIKNTLTADDDVLTLADGIYVVWGVVPKNIPDISSHPGSGSDWGYITVKSTKNLTRWVNFYSVSGNSATNILSGSPATWGGWRVPNSTTMASKYDVTTAVNTATANMVDSSKPTNFTAGLQSGGVDVATAADLKSIKDSAWRELDLSGTSGIYTGKILIKIDQVDKYVYFIMNAQIPRNVCSQGTKIIDLSKVVTGLSSAHGYLQGWLDDRENPYSIEGSTISVSGACLTFGGGYASTTGKSRIATEADPGQQYCYAVYDDLVNS